MTKLTNLSLPLQVGDLTFKNRVVMSAMTRNRNQVPDIINAEYYSQRASSGLIITESTLIEPQGSEWLEAPGIWSKRQVEGWKLVVDSVHKVEGKIFVQLWHPGRCVNSMLNCGKSPVSASAVQADAGKFRMLENQPGFSLPEAVLDPTEYVQMFKEAATNAKLAGFDGIEIHAGSDYLIHSFLESHTNLRTDKYGGSIENKVTFLELVLNAVSEVFPSNRIGIKLTPGGGYNDMGEKNLDLAYQLYSYVISILDTRGLAYIQMSRALKEFDFKKRSIDIDYFKLTSSIKHTKVIFNRNFTPEESDKLISEGKVDAIAFGRLFIANPDLPQRLFNGYPLQEFTQYDMLYNYKTGDKRFAYADFTNYKP